VVSGVYGCCVIKLLGDVKIICYLEEVMVAV